MHPTSHALASCFGLETVSHEVFGCKAEWSPSSKALSDASVAFPLRRLMDTAVHSSYAHLQVGGTGTSARKSSVLHLIEENMCCIFLPAFKIVKYFWWSSLFVISIVPQLFVNVAILLVFNKENEILGFYWVQQTSLVYPHVGIHPWGPLSIL